MVLQLISHQLAPLGAADEEELTKRTVPMMRAKERA